MVKCLDATTYVQTGTHAVFRGPGAGLDTFSISTDSGYSASGVLADGNIQVHP
jgi:hypothetical protein